MRLTEHLKTDDIQALVQLVKACKKNDDHKIATYPDLLADPRPKPSSILLFHQKKLIGFAAAFFFESDCAEISLLIHPKYRKQGLAKTCLQTLLQNIIYHRPVPKLSFSVPHTLWHQALQQHGLAYQSTEYEMKYAGKTLPPLVLAGLEVRQATTNDMAALCELDQRCFPETSPYSEMRFQTLLNRTQHIIFLLIQNHQVIGKAHVNWDKNTAFLSDIAVLPEKQHQGFGAKITSYCIHFAFQLPQHNIRLSVDTHNQSALQLYSHLGFKVINAIDYWRGSFAEIHAKLDTFK